MNRQVAELQQLPASVGGRQLFQIQDDKGDQWIARKVILATGVEDILPPIPGFGDIWGKSVIHCVFCHGTETKGSPIAILLNPASGPMGNGAAISMFIQKFRNLHNKPVTILANGVFGDATEPSVTPKSGISQDLLDLIKSKG